MSIFDKPAHCGQIATRLCRTSAGFWAYWCNVCGASAVHDNSKEPIPWCTPDSAMSQKPDQQAEREPPSKLASEFASLDMQMMQSQIDSEIKMLRRQHDIMFEELKGLHSFDKWAFNAIADLRGVVNRIQIELKTDLEQD